MARTRPWWSNAADTPSEGRARLLQTLLRVHVHPPSSSPYIWARRNRALHEEKAAEDENAASERS